jgi:hypothetical protein
MRRAHEEDPFLLFISILIFRLFRIQCRAVYYVFMAATRDEEIQKRGVVLIYYIIGQTKFRTDRPPKVADLFWLLPVRLVAMHLCGHSTLHNEIGNRISENLEGHYLCRFRYHNGTYANNKHTQNVKNRPKIVAVAAFSFLVLIVLFLL